MLGYMSEQEKVLGRLSKFTAFATLGVIGTTQDIVRLTLKNLDGAVPENVAEESLCLVATATARAAEVGLRQEGAVASVVSPTVMDLPFAYRDYLIGGAMINRRDTSLLDANEAAYRRLQEKRDYYKQHFPENQFPGPSKVKEIMEVWLARVAPGGAPDATTERLEQLGVFPQLMTHLKLILAFGRQG